MMKVYYAKDPMYTVMPIVEPNRDTFPQDDFVALDVQLPSNVALDRIFEYLNSAQNPLKTAESQRWLAQQDLSHTSMSVGDIVQDDHGRLMMCTGRVWKPVQWE